MVENTDGEEVGTVEQAFRMLESGDTGRMAIEKEQTVAKAVKLLRAARDYPCVLCGTSGKTVPAHCNDGEFKGIGKKAPDFLVAYVCHDCHQRIDGVSGGLLKAEKRAMWDHAYKRTVALWFRDGLVCVE